MHNAKAIPTTRRAGGLFVLQSFVFRISEKLLNGEQGFALTKKAAFRSESPLFCLFLYVTQKHTVCELPYRP